MTLWTAGRSARCLRERRNAHDQIPIHRLTDVLCGGNLRVFSKAQVIAALIGGAIGAFLGVQAYCHGWLG